MTRPESQLLPLGDFKPANEWQTHVNAIFYGTLGPAIHHHFQTYVSRDYRLAHALADQFVQNVRQHGPADGPIHVQEWGVGSGNLAARFLSHLKSADESVYSRLRYTLCDYSEEILNGVRANENLKEHEGVTTLQKVNAEGEDDFEPQSVHKIISNEIWDDLATSVLLKNDGMLYEEYLQPTLSPNATDIPLETLVEQFNARDLDALKSGSPFLEQIVWERSFQRTDISDWPQGDVIQKHLDRLADEIPFPINTGAFKTLERAQRLLAENNLGYSSFDYGMLSDHELNLPGRPYFKLYGGQYTSMVNFPLIAEVAQAMGFGEVTLEPQHDFVGRHQIGRAHV